MKICVTAGTTGINALFDPRFGRCPFFVVIETESMTEESVPNPGAESSGGAGIQAAQLVTKLGVAALITGNIGPNALQTLNAAGIDVYHYVEGSVKEASEQFKRNELQKITPSSAQPYAGKGRGRIWQGPPGQGRGGGRGRGGLEVEQSQGYSSGQPGKVGN